MNKKQIKLAEKTLNLLSKKSWNFISVNEVLKGYKNLPKAINNKNDLLRNINRYVDHLLKIETKSLDNSTQTDMLFEVIMARFDILQKYRKSFIKLYDSFKFNPQKSLIFIPSFLESMLLSADIAKINSNGLKGRMIIKGLFIIYIATFLVWIKDETKSLEKTMTALDKYLAHGNKIINGII